MGFRDLFLFNQAMLAKQGWRLITEPDSLSACVLKGRYFPNIDFWNATKKTRSSWFILRSILHGWDLLKHGIRWGIDDGRTVKITYDNWMPKLPPGLLKLTSPIPESAMVHCLIDKMTSTWNQESVHSFFSEAATKQILRVPVALHDRGDFDCWPFTRHGIYIVWSSYNFARLYKFLKLRVQLARVWAWVGQKMRRIGKQSEAYMRREDEDSSLLFCTWLLTERCSACLVIRTGGWLIYLLVADRKALNMWCLYDKFARATWREMKQHVPMHLNRKKNFAIGKQLLFDFLGHACDIQVTTMVVGFWYIWEERNESWNEDVKPIPSHTRGKVVAIVGMTPDSPKSTSHHKTINSKIRVLVGCPMCQGKVKGVLWPAAESPRPCPIEQGWVHYDVCHPHRQGLTTTGWPHRWLWSLH
jgi:hypothetical protein